MSRMDDLIRRHCSDGVPRETFNSLGTIQRGKRFVKDDLTKAGAPCIHYGEIYTKYGLAATRSFSFLPPDHASRLRSAHPGDVIIASAGETVEDIGKAVAWLGQDDIVIHDACYAFSSSLNPKYVAYFLQTDDFHDQARPLISSSKISSISTENLGKIQVPVPPAEVQDEIVRTLDLFQSLDAELASELAARQLQYAHYRAELLTAPEVAGAARLRLGDVATVRVGQALPGSGVLKDGPFPYVNAGTAESGRADEANTPGGAITIPSRGQGGVGVVGFQWSPFWCGPLCYRIVSAQEDVRTRFLYYYLKSIQRSIRALQQTGGTPALNRKELVLVEVAVPAVEEQDRIVSILDKLDALVHDMSTGLPAELKARRAQYEYYRDRLLSFDNGGPAQESAV